MVAVYGVSSSQKGRVGMPKLTPKVPLTVYQQHKQRWADGCGSEQCGVARRRCFMRGSVPCELLFVGEAPGESENVIGQPFVGPAGQLLDFIVSRSVLPSVRWAMTNVVCCIPRQEEEGSSYAGASSSRRKKAGQPSVEQVQACMPRLQEFVGIAKPRLIVCVGTVARDWLDTKYLGRIKLPGDPIPRVAVDHPAHILRMPQAQQGLAIRRVCVTIANAVDEFIVPF
jgi:uracil-DNA glycosylase